MKTSNASARWTGDLKSGTGSVRSHTLDAPYSFATRFGEQTGTNPEELIGAALSSCFAMALSHALAGDGHVPESVEARARVHLDADAPRISRIELGVEAEVPGLDADTFRSYAADAKANCPVSKALGGVEIELTEARLADAG